MEKRIAASKRVNGALAVLVRRRNVSKAARLAVHNALLARTLLYCNETILVCSSAAQSGKFPPHFKFGAATAAYQVEGAWNASDKSANIWDHFVHTKPERIDDSSSGDIACDSYNQWQRDVEIAEELGLHFYRFSISWTRLLPRGFAGYVSQDGKEYYNKLIDALIKKGIQPVLTLYHWDLPQSLQDLGGWTNPLIVDWFANYARVAFTLFGDRVKTWITLNEPIVFCDVAYHTALHAPGVHSPSVGSYICIKNAMLAHAKAWRIYDDEFRYKYHGKLSLTNQLVWIEKENENDDEMAVELALQLIVGMFSHPIYSKEGGWPLLLREILKKKMNNFLPEFTKEEVELVKGTYDFYGLNYYTTRLARMAKEEEQIGVWPVNGHSDFDLILSVSPDWESTGANWLYAYPKGLRNQLRWLKQEYGDIEIIIMENGFATYNSTLEDDDRIDYYKQHLEQVLLAIEEDKVNVTGYTAWTMLDNFEWVEGYRSKFGLYQVDFEHPKRTRTPRASAEYYKRVIKHHGFNVDSNKITDEL